MKRYFAPIINCVPCALRIDGAENGIRYHKRIYSHKQAIAVRRRQHHVHQTNRFMTSRTSEYKGSHARPIALFRQ